MILISVNLVKPAGSHLDSSSCLHLHKLLLADAQRKARVEEELQEKVVFELDFEGVFDNCSKRRSSFREE